MKQDEDFDRMASACLAAHESLENSGTPEMLATMRILLFQIGQELARRQLATEADLLLV